MKEMEMKHRNELMELVNSLPKDKRHKLYEDTYKLMESAINTKPKETKMHRNDIILIVAIVVCCILAGAVQGVQNISEGKLASARAALVETQRELDDLKHDAVIYGYAERGGTRHGFAWKRGE